MRLAALAAFAAASFWTAESHAQPILRYAFEGAIMNTQLGVAVAAGDVNGDGTRDFILATVVGPRVQVYSGTTGAWLREWLALGEITFGRKLASADFDGDGADDVVVASDRLNVVHVFSGATGALLFDAPGEAEGSGYGEALAAGDVNHDGMADLLVGAPAADGAAGADSGKVYVFGGPTGAPLYTLEGEAAGDRFGSAVAVAPDVSGDGGAELLVGAPYVDVLGRRDVGRAYLHSGDGALIRTFEATAAVPAEDSRFGAAVAAVGRFQPGGGPAVAISAPRFETSRAQLAVFDATEGSLIAEAIEDVGDFDSKFDILVAAGDVDGDGLEDLLTFWRRGLLSGGRARVYAGPDATRIFELGGEQTADDFARTLAGVGDVDGDGRGEVLIGASLFDGAAGDGCGKAYVITACTDQDGDGALDCRGDCAPGDPAIHPGATEVCDDVDDDCDGVLNNGLDCDGDGFAVPDDCDDADAAIHPGAAEVCDPIDQNCDGVVNDGLDCDGDGSPVPADCDDADAAIHSGASEICNSVDDDCDGAIDESVTDPDADPDGDGVCVTRDNCPQFFNPVQTDADGDGWGPPCDCNDNDPRIRWSAWERFPDIGIPGVDDNCNGVVDLCGALADPRAAPAGIALFAGALAVLAAVAASRRPPR